MQEDPALTHFKIDPDLPSEFSEEALAKAEEKLVEDDTFRAKKKEEHEKYLADQKARIKFSVHLKRDHDKMRGMPSKKNLSGFLFGNAPPTLESESDNEEGGEEDDDEEDGEEDADESESGSEDGEEEESGEEEDGEEDADEEDGEECRAARMARKRTFLDKEYPTVSKPSEMPKTASLASEILTVCNAIGKKVLTPTRFFDANTLTRKQRGARFFAGKIVKKAILRKGDEPGFVVNYPMDGSNVQFYLNKHSKPAPGKEDHYLTAEDCYTF